MRASKKLRGDDSLVLSLGSTILRKHLDDVPLWRGNHVSVKQLVEDFARYLYLPRLAGPEVLVQAARDGVALLTWKSDTFGYAESYDESTSRYLGLRGGQIVSLSVDDRGLLVRPDVAHRQIVAEESTTTARDRPEVVTPTRAEVPADAKAGHVRRFHGTVALDPTRVGRDASRIADEVIAHLAGQLGAVVKVTLDIDVTLPAGLSDHIVRTVTENSRTLKFSSHGFDKE